MSYYHLFHDDGNRVFTKWMIMSKSFSLILGHNNVIYFIFGYSQLIYFPHLLRWISEFLEVLEKSYLINCIRKYYSQALYSAGEGQPW